MSLWEILICIGLLWAAWQLWYIFPRSRLNLKSRYGAGTWAVITGGSDGIGLSFAHEFARQNFNLVIIARTQEKLNHVREELQEKYQIQVKTFSLDFSTLKIFTGIEDIFNAIQDLEVSILVNNVGGGEPSTLADMKPEQISEQLCKNLWSMILWTHYTYSNFFKNSKKHKAWIIVNSTAGTLRSPSISIYSGCKAAGHYFAQVLSLEHPQVDVLSVLPMVVSTPQMKHKEVGVDVIHPSSWVSATLSKLGIFDATYGHWIHSILGTISLILPEELTSKIIDIEAKKMIRLNSTK